MKKPRTYNRENLSQVWMELVTLGVLTAIAVAHLFDLHWSMAVGAAPFVMLSLLLAVALLVEILWLFVAGVDKCGQALGLRKSPLT